MEKFWLKCVLALIFGTLGTNSGGDPFPNQPRLVVENGHLTIRSGFDRNVSISTKGQGNVMINNISMSSLASSQSGRALESATVTSLNRQMGNILNQWQSMSDLANQVNQLEENITDISQRMNLFLGTDQNRITNRGMRRYFAKVKMLEDKVNHLTELLSTNECSSNPCRNGGTCVDSYNGYVCNCLSTWEGPTCESDVNECALYSGTAFGCQHGATCTNLPGSYRCDCATNWFGIHCTEQLDDCNAASHQELCGHGTCVNENRVQPGQPKYRCICDAGWSKAPGSPACTQDEDECQGSQPKCSVNPRVLCINLPGTFYCGPCPAGYTGNGLYCEDVNECETRNGGCSMNPFVECYNIPGSRRCGPCPAGYFGNGEQCMFQSVCNNNRGGCHPLATCIDNPAITTTYRECRCPIGYVGSGEGLTGCVPTQGITCANNPCQHGTCQTVGNSYHCVCEAGYYGTNCENAQDLCARNPCQNGGTCVSAAGTFTCTCPSGFSGPTCAEQQRVCGGYLTGNNGTLHYPEYSIHYDHEESCAWVITVEEGKVINVTFDHFHLEAGYNCEFDFLQLNDGPNAGSMVIGRFCSDQLHGDTFTSTHNKVYMWFKSDRTIAATGFTITWKAIDPVCGGILNVSEYGSVRSPGYPGMYPVNRTCSWLVQVPFGKRIQFSFATLMLEHHPNCSYDYLKVFDGASDRDPVIGTYCTTDTPPPLITSGHTATLLFHSDPSVQDSGFNIAYSATPGIPGCGGTLTAPKGVITSPNFPDTYENNLVCEWLVRIHPDNRIKISFTNFNLELHPTCMFDSLEIYDGPSDSGPIIGRFCGENVPVDIISNSHQLYIRFKSDMWHRLPGFKLEYNTICGGIFSDLTGVTSSPFYPDPYPAHATCLYEISLPRGYIVNLTLENIEIEYHTNCRWDYLEVRDGDSETSPLLSTVCGYLPPKNFLSTYNRLWMKFETDGSVQNRGFTAEYTGIEIGCGGIQTENNGQIASPRHPDSYPHSITCTWLIKAPEGHIIRLTFSSFHLEQSGNCGYDYLVIEDAEGAQIGKFCGIIAPPVFTSLDDRFLVKFVTDASIARDGFVATYEFLDASQACGGEIYQGSGTIKSPGYPDHYPHSANCVWVFHAPNSRQITLNVTDFNMEYHDNCKYDYLEIRNGGYKTSPLIGKYCGTQIMPIIRSHSNLLRLEFKSDISMSAPGFQISFDTSTVGCGGTLTSSRGTIVSPNYPQAYPLNADCQWLITVSQGSVVSVSIVDIDIEEHATCNYDYLQIFDGDSENSKSLIRICNNQQNPGFIVSSGSNVLVRFRSDFGQEAGGFHLVYHTQCNSVLTKRRGVLESPNFPNGYPHNHNCTWTIQAPMGSNVSLSFSHLFIEGDDNCSLDYVEVLERPQAQDSPVSLGKFCGDMTRPPSTIITTSNTAIVRLITDRSISREGFRLEWSFIGCGGDIFDKSYGSIASPNYPQTYPLRTACYWHIWYPPGNSVEFTITDLDIESSSDCYYDFLRVYGGEDVNAPRLLNTCHTLTNSTVITSHGNEIYVHFQSDVTIAHRGFRAEYRVIRSGCGGRFTANAATIMSPNFPDPYTINDDCEWLIEVPSINRAILEFYDFEMPEAANCSHGHVAVYDGSNSSAPLLLKHCGAKPEGSIYATGNQMLVKLVADGNNIAKGFRAHYRAGCGRRLVADNGGEITSPNYPNLILSTDNCSWIIYASEIGEKVSLTVTHLNIFDHDNCSYGALYVYDGDMEDSPSIGQYCGYRLPPTIVSRSSILRVFLKNEGIFRAVYGLLSEHCGGSFTSAAGSFASPGYPTNYDMEMECVWTIEASAGSKVHVSFQSFNLENSDYCNSDYLEIHENDPSGRLIGKYCGNNVPSNVTAAHKLWIKFRSDDIGTAPGFMAHYELEHGTTINGTSGDIASPGYPHRYQHSDDFQWTVIVPEGMFVSVYFRQIDIVTYGTTDECYAYVKIIDGFDEEAPVIDQFCGNVLPEPVVSTGNVITVQFHSLAYLPSSFYLRWSAVNETGARPSEDVSCLEEHIINSTSLAVVQSPNYPEKYPDEYNCTYIVRTVPTHHIDLQFEAFELEGSPPGCNFDRVQSFTIPNPSVDWWNLNSTLCGEIPNLHLSSPNNVMILEMSTDRWVNARGFKATARAECGGQLFGNSGILRSSSVYPNMLNMSRYETFSCEWVITVKERRTIQLTFDNFDIESDAVCSNNYILIRNGGYATSPVLGSGRYCGTSTPVLPETSSNQAYVQLSYRPTSGRSPMFDLRYSVMTMGCGGHLYLSPDIPSTEIMSPNYPSAPTHDADCEWIIVSPAASRMRVDFESDFRLGPNCYSYEYAEYLQIHDGGTENADVLRRFCGYDTPSSVMSTSNALFIKFVSGNDDRGSGFKATVRMAHCGGTISAFYAHIQSPNYPQNYGSSVECEWFLKMRYGYHITLMIEEFETPSSDNCSLTDYLEIRDMDKEGEVLGTYCGNPSNFPISIEVPGPDAYLKFKSNSAVTAKGFSMIMRANYDEGCGGQLEGPSGVVTSPRYPNAISVPRECYWRINGPAGRRIKVTFEEINLPYDENLDTCASYVTIYNVTHRYESRNRDFRYRFCGTTLPQEVDSSTNGLYIVFSTHGLSAGQGFKLRYSSEEESLCGGVLPLPSGILTSPNFTVQNDTYVECLWTADLAENQTLSFKFDYLDLPGSVANFCRPSLLFLYAAGGRYLGGYCGNITNAFILTAPYPSVHLRLISSLEMPIGGFRAAYNVSDCGGVLSGTSAEITSPGYPNNYPAGIDCEWIIWVPYGEIIQLTFQDLRLEEDCTKDYVMVRNGQQVRSPAMGKFCGSHSVAPIFSTGQSLSIIFHSDNFGSAPGFRISTTEVQRGCGGTIHSQRGNLSSPNYPSRYDNNIECTWTFEYTLGTLVNVEFTGRFDIEMDPSCSKDYLQFEDMDSDGRWVVREKKCGSVTPSALLSTSNKLRMTFRSNDRIQGDGFGLTYSASCGGNFTNPQGSIISPNYPDFYTDNLRCSYVIGKLGDYISLTFDDLFSIEGHDSCFFDYIEIYQGEVNETSKQGRYCGDVIPAPRTLLGPVIVNFYTDYSYVAHGFKLHYDIMNCGAVFTTPTGVIATPNVTGEYLNNMDCTWHIIGTPTQVIQIRFLYFHLEESYSCWRDYLQIFDGNSTSSPSIGRLCGDGAQNVKSSSHEVTLKFHTNYRMTSRGFRAYFFRTYGEDQGCGGTFNATTGVITSVDANSDGFYEPDLDCAWLILANEPDQIVKLNFETFDLQAPHNGSCDFDYLEVREYDPNGPMIGRYCGNTNPAPIMTTATTVFVHFHSDNTGSNSGFRLRYTISPSPCGRSSFLSGPEPQTLTSPSYPNAYPTNIRCKWTITRNYTGSYVYVNEIDIFVTNMDIPCGGDYLELKKTRSYMASNDDLIRTCGTTPPQVLNIRTGIEIIFNSDASDDGGHGFSLTFKDASCNSTFTDDNGIITSASYPMRVNAGTACVANITVPEGRTVALYFRRFDIPYSADCEAGSMKIRDGNAATSPLVATYCGPSIPNPVFSTGRSLYLDTYLPSRVGLYFLTYTSTDKGRGCGGRFHGTEGSFSSPLYPSAYNKTGECFWYITVPGYHTVNLQFTSFALNSTANCDTNYLEIFEGSTDDVSKRVARFCGSDVPADHELRSNEAVVKLVTDATNNQPGFYANFEVNTFVPDNVPLRVVQRFGTETSPQY